VPLKNRQIKLLQSENAVLRKRLAQEEKIEVQSLVTKEIQKMSTDDLRSKIIKISQAYRDERIRNDEFEKALKAAQRDIASTTQLQNEYENLQKAHVDNSRKLLAMQQEIKQIGLYRETIKKQERVIAKLEKLLETTLKDTQKNKKEILELEKLKTENLQLQKQLKTMAYGPEGEGGELEKYKLEVSKLERIVAELRDEIKSKRPQTSYGDEVEREKIELEVNLAKAQARIEAIQSEMTENARNFAREISDLKIQLTVGIFLIDSIL
jgi:chromosome segregation ATPase